MKFKKALSVLLVVAMLFSVLTVGVVAVSAEEVDTAVTAADIDVASAGSAYSDMLSKVTPENQYGLSKTVDDGTILQAWTISYANIRANLATIAEQGFTTIQVSPPNEIKKGTKGSKFLQSNNANGWWMFYQPAGFQLNQSTDNALGTKSEFEAMCSEAHALGLKVIADAVINHMGTKDGDDNNTSSDPMSHVTPKAQTFEPEIYNNKLFHSPWKQMQYIESNNTQYNSTYDLTRNCTSGLPDLKTEDSRVQTAIYDYMEELVQAGADGYRFDAAKHIETPDDISGLRSDFWTNTLKKVQQNHPEKEIYAYGEILNTCGINRPFSMYTKLFDVTDSGSYWGIKNAVTGEYSGNPIPYYPNSNFTAANTVLWDESHDTYVDGSTTSLNTTQRGKIWALVAGRAGISSVYLARPSDATNTNDLYNITMGDLKKTSWSNATTKAINQFHNYFIGQAEYCSNSGGTAWIERGTSGAMIVNLGGTTTKNVSLRANKLAAGEYKDAITGNKFTVSGGKITGQVGSTGVAAIYENSAEPTEPPTQKPTDPPETYILGDVDGDGEAGDVDAALILRSCVDLITLTDKQARAADVDGDGMVTPIDATLIQRYAVFIKVKYPIGEEQVVVPVAPTVPVNPTSPYNPTSSYDPTFAPPEPEEVTLYFSNNKFWSDVNVYMWSDGGESTSWPGEAARKIGTNDYGEDIYSITIDTSVYDHVIFNGSGGQTEDVDVVYAESMGAGLYCLDTQNDMGHYEVGYYLYNVPPYDPSENPDPPTPSDSVTLFFSNNKFWDSVNVYMWSDAGDESTAWPGVAAHKVGTNDFGEDIYSVTVDTTVYDHVIFNGSGGQTGDIDVAYAESMGCGVYCLDTQNEEGHYGVGYYEYQDVNPSQNPSDDPNPPTPGETVTLYFSNNKHWDSVNVYMFSTEGGESTAWPGVAADKVGTNDFGEDIYSVTVDTGIYDSVIFNGSGGQTADISAAYADAMGGGIYCLDTTDGDGHYEVGYYEYEDVNPSQDPSDDPNPPTPGETVTLYFSNNKHWDSVNVYMFSTEGGESTAWPGVAADKIGTNDFGEDIYSVTVDTGIYDSVIFNGSGGQTADISAAYANAMGGGIYCLDTTDGDGHYEVGYYEYEGVTDPSTDPSEDPSEDPGTGVSFLLTDNFGWGSAYVYAWDANGTELYGGWPGAAQAETIVNDYGETQFRCYVPDGAVGVILSNGNGAQTEDITDFSHTGYWMDGTKNSSGHFKVTAWD